MHSHRNESPKQGNALLIPVILAFSFQVKNKSIFDVPDSIECIHCDNEIVRPAEHAIIVYKVL